jgi:hypothetical protein
LGRRYLSSRQSKPLLTIILDFFDGQELEFHSL